MGVGVLGCGELWMLLSMWVWWCFSLNKAYSFMIVLHRRCAYAYLCVCVCDCEMYFWYHDFLITNGSGKGNLQAMHLGIHTSKVWFSDFLQSTFDTFHYDYLEDIDHSMKNVCIPPAWSYMHIITRLKGDQVAAKWNIHMCISL